MAYNLVSKGYNIRLSCKVCSISPSSYYYQYKNSSDNKLIAQKLLQLTKDNNRWGFKMCYFYLKNVEKLKFNHKRIYRIYKELELNLRIKPKKRIQRDKPQELINPNKKNQIWSMDFMSDNLANKRKIRSFNVIDDYKREALTINFGLSLPSSSVIHTLQQLITKRNKPKIIRCDNGPEYISNIIKEWATKNNIKLEYIQPGKPTQNAYIERFNRTVREELFNQNVWQNIKQAQELADKWIKFYNNKRPHFANNGLPPLMKIT